MADRFEADAELAVQALDIVSQAFGGAQEFAIGRY
jgi:hypothetical protein